MNFQTVNQSQGQYIKMWAQIVNAKPVKQGKYGPNADILLMDQNNVKQAVNISAGQYNGLIPNTTHVGQNYEFSIKAAQTQQGLRYYGFCSEKAQAGPPNAPQGPQNARQATNARPVSPDSLFIGKQAVWKGYCEAVKNSEGAFDVNIAIDQCWQVWNEFITPEAQPLELANDPNDFQQFADEHPVEQDGNPY
jgi:hypothetical protein